MRRRSARMGTARAVRPATADAPREGMAAEPGAEGAGRALRRLGLAAVCAAGLLGCTAIERRHGYVPDDAALSLIALGIDTRESVSAKIGDPSSTSVLEGGDYYYVSSRRSTFAYRPTVVTDREVVAVSFDPAGLVANVERFGLERGRVVPLSRRVTEPNVRSIGFLRQVFGSLGQIRAEDVLEN